MESEGVSSLSWNNKSYRYRAKKKKNHVFNTKGKMNAYISK